MPVRQSGNQEWIEWLEEALVECEARPHGENRAKSWKTAIRALRAHQVTLEKPDDAKLLHGIGQVTVNYIKKRESQKYKGLGQSPPPELELAVLSPLKKTKKAAAAKSATGRSRYDTTTNDEAEDAESVVKSKKRKHPSKNNGKGAEAPNFDFTPSSNVEYERPSKKAKGKEKEKVPDTYVPRKRTGAYALLIAFVKLINQRRDIKASADQATLMEMASPYSEKSFVDKVGGNPKPHGSGFYSAWNGMKTLQDHGYVTKFGRAPVLRQLSPAGYRVANICAQTEGVPTFDAEKLANLPTSYGRDASSGSDEDDIRPDVPQSNQEQIQRPKASTSRRRDNLLAMPVDKCPGLDQGGPKQRDQQDGDDELRYVYLAEGDVRTVWRDSAQTHVDVDDNFATVFKIEYSNAQRTHAILDVCALPGDIDLGNRTDKSTRAGWMRDSGAAMKAPGLLDAAPSSSAPTIGIRHAAADAALRRANAGGDAIRDSLMGKEQRTEAVDKRAMYKQASRPLVASSSSASIDPCATSAKAKPQLARTSSSSSAAPARPPSPVPSRITGPRPSLKNSSAAATAYDPSRMDTVRVTAKAGAKVKLPNFDPDRDSLVMRPGEFDVYVVVDNREHKVLPKVKESVGKVFQESLALGDFIWIAKRKVPTGDAERDSFVLDAVLERKRLDDLFKSMQDGRLEEQKIRIKQSGTTRRMYMIELYGRQSLQKHANFEQQLATIKSQSQVSDGFLLHMLDSVEEGIKHIVRCTRVLSDLYKDSTLYAIPDRFVDRLSYIALQDHLRSNYPMKPFLTSFDAYQRINRKQHTVGSGWANMLFQQHGLSEARCCDIIETWPTIIECYEAVQNFKREIKADSKLTDAKREKAFKEFFEKSLCNETTNRQLNDRGRINGVLSGFLWNLFACKDYSKPDVIEKSK